MDKYSSVNALSSFENFLPTDFFVKKSESSRSHKDDNDSDNEDNSFEIHRKLLRRRHVRKLQKAQEREREREEQKQKEEEEENRLEREWRERRRVVKKQNANARSSLLRHPSTQKYIGGKRTASYCYHPIYHDHYYYVNNATSICSTQTAVSYAVLPQFSPVRPSKTRRLQL